MPPKGRDLTGERFGRLTILGEAGKVPLERYLLLVLCDCGQEKIVQRGHITRGGTKSCGCYGLELQKLGNPKHGLSRTATYAVWSAMIQRCTNPNIGNYELYGARGIKVAPRWLESVENFYADMGECPPGCSIDRIDNDGDYCPENCRWTTPKVQSRNTRTNRHITYGGKTQCVTAWAEELSVPRRTLFARLYAGWTEEKALTEPFNGRR
ncbi:hypothetical protein [Chroococcidiopsis sp. CCMEE 29]|uniref:hypothetical protein n=1 Tax=Chroococcidiopsis sp. CCMEE 29 TaxID=155894 RepID=UPI0020210677|nr:hypothetical protein [Chroococcidiopsis sp. CCMEE 29]